ncbi:MAG: hypothetical protein ACI9TF_000982 [Paracrocinitomix sp.]|jgi:hypothetical protein
MATQRFDVTGEAVAFADTGGGGEPEVMLPGAGDVGPLLSH